MLRKRAGTLNVQDDGTLPSAPIVASRCRYGYEASCWYTEPRQAIWVWGAQHTPGLSERFGARGARGAAGGRGGGEARERARRGAQA